MKSSSIFPGQTDRQMKADSDGHQRTKGGTIVPPSDFQPESTKTPEYKGHSPIFPRGYTHAHAQVRENLLFDIIHESMLVDVFLDGKVYHLDLNPDTFRESSTKWQCTVSDYNPSGTTPSCGTREFIIQGQRINGMNVPGSMQVYYRNKQGYLRLVDYTITAIDGETVLSDSSASSDACFKDMDTEDKIKHAKLLIKSICSQRNYTMAFSGGKDSVVLRWLTRLAGVTVPMVYNNTTIDPPGTIKFVRSQGATVQQPVRSFFEIVERKGYPTMFKRFCCAELKEKYIADYLLTGVRKSESVKRNKNYCAFEDTFSFNKHLSTKRFHPLLYFTNADIKYIIETYQLECHSLYYDPEGNFHVERRLGCIGCPLLGDRGRADFLKYPKLLVQMAKAGNKFHLKHGRTLYDSYENLCWNLFYSNHGKLRYDQTFRGLFPADPKEIIENYFHIQLP